MSLINYDHVKKICGEEKIDIDDEAIKIIVRRGGGSFRDTLSLLDQISTISDGKITAETVTKSLGLPQDDVIQELLSAYSAGYIQTILLKLLQYFNCFQNQLLFVFVHVNHPFFMCCAQAQIRSFFIC